MRGIFHNENSNLVVEPKQEVNHKIFTADLVQKEMIVSREGAKNGGDEESTAPVLQREILQLLDEP